MRATRSAIERGFTTVEIMAIVSFSFLILVFLTNMILIQFGLGLIRAAADEGARAGARVSADPIGACEQRQLNVTNGVGGLINDFTFQCTVEAGQIGSTGRITATNTASFPIWLGFGSDINSSATATAVKEEVPNP